MLQVFATAHVPFSNTSRATYWTPLPRVGHPWSNLSEKSEVSPFSFLSEQQ